MRYLLLVLLNLPIVLLAFVSLLTKYKIKHISKERFRSQILLWCIILAVVVGSFPVYNIVMGNAAFESRDFSLFDIVQTTVIIILIYVINGQRQKIEHVDRRLRDLHQELSIVLSSKK